MADESYRLAKEVEAAKVLRDRYKEALGDDAEAIADTIEGETNLFEKIEAMLESIAEDKALAGAIKSRQDDLSDRKHRIEHRIETKRTLVLTALQIAEVKKREFAIGTVSRSAIADKPIVTSEADVPARFFKTPPPVLDKKAINDHYRVRLESLKGANTVDDPEKRKEMLESINKMFPELPGVTVSNGGEAIVVSFK